MLCQCPVCRYTLQISRKPLNDDLVRCDHCHTMFIAPLPPAAVPESADLAAIAQTHSTRPPRPLRRGRSTLGLVGLCGLAALFMLLGTILLLMQLSSASAAVTVPRTTRAPVVYPTAESSGELFPDVKAMK